MGMLVVNSDYERLYGKKNYAEQYLTLEALEDGTFSFKIPQNHEIVYLKYISYSTDNGKTWIKTDNINNTEVLINVENVKKGDSVLWKGNGLTTSHYGGSFFSCFFSSTCNYNISGNIMSLLYEDDFICKTNFPDPQWIGYGFSYLFDEGFSEHHVINAEKLILPSEFPAYSGMFRNCTLLTTVPELPATTLSWGCYETMFTGCTSLTTAPELPATTLSSDCYNGMFSGCTNLNYIKILATDISANGCLNNWVNNVSPTGTFIKPAGVEYPTGASGIPSGWTVEEI